MNGLLLVLVALVAATSPAAAQDFYYSDGRRIPLERVEGWVTVQVAERDRSALKAASRLAGTLQIRTALNADRGVYWMEAPRGVAPEAALSRLRQAAEIERVTPGYRLAGTGTDMTLFILTDAFRAVFRTEVSQEQIREMNERYGVEVVEVSARGRYLLRVTGQSALNALEAANRYYESGLVRWSVPDYLINVELEGIGDPLFPQQWHLRNTGQAGGVAGVDINAVPAWDITTGSGDVVVAVIDDGVEAHEDFYTGQLLSGWTGGGGDGAPRRAEDRHGQAVAGIVAAHHNERGVRGVASGAKILPINIRFDSSLLTFIDYAAYGIEWAWMNGADILQNSWGVSSPGYSDDGVTWAIEEALAYGRDGKGSVVIKSAGNTGAHVTFPGTVPGVLVVGAVTNQDQSASYSARGPEIDVVAPSRGGTLGITTTDRMGTSGYTTTSNGHYYDDFGGTSAAAPQVSGVAALMLSVNPNLNGQEVRNLIQSTADDYGNTNWDGSGRVNAHAAVLASLPVYANQTLGTSTYQYARFINATLSEDDQLTIPAGGYAIVEGTFTGRYQSRVTAYGMLVYEAGAAHTGGSIRTYSSGAVVAHEGVTMEFRGNESFASYGGEVHLEGTEQAPVRLQPLAGSSTWGGLYLFWDPYATLVHTTVEDTNSGVYGDGAYLRAHHLAVRNSGSHALRLTNGSFGFLRDTDLTGAAQDGLRAENADIIGGYDEEDYRYQYNESRLRITGNGRYGVYLGPIASVEIGDDFDFLDYYVGGYNAIFGNGSHEVYIEDDFTDPVDSYITAEQTWWGQSPPLASEFFHSYYGGDPGDWYIDNTPYLSSDPGAGSGHRVSHVVAASSGVTRSAPFKDAEAGRGEGRDVRALLSEVRRLRRARDWAGSEALLASVVADSAHPLAQLARVLRLSDLSKLRRVAEVVTEGETVLAQESRPRLRALAARALFSTYLFGEGNVAQATAMIEELAALGVEEATDGTLASVLNDIAGGEERSVAPNRTASAMSAASQAVDSFGVSAYPNPFVGTATFRLELPTSGRVALRVYDVLGREVVTLLDESRKIGMHEVLFDGRKLPSGVYVWQVEAAGQRETGRLTLMR